MQQPVSKSYRYYDLIMAAFVTVLLAANLIGGAKVCEIFGISFSAGVLFFPASYLFGDILTEVYGYARSRKVVWAGFIAMIFASAMASLVVALPPAEGWHNQDAFEIVFGSTWRITLGSLTAYFVGEFANSFTLAKMKIATKGKYLWSRTIGSTIVGEFFDSMIFYPIAFMGIFSNELLIRVMLANYLMKVCWEVAATPLTYWFVAFLKKREREDYYDYKTDFTPFSLKT
ncbi:MAG: queuosine precursor transporter [Bdellovibrionota bacterium]